MTELWVRATVYLPVMIPDEAGLSLAEMYREAEAVAADVLPHLLHRDLELDPESLRGTRRYREREAPVGLRRVEKTSRIPKFAPKNWEEAIQGVLNLEEKKLM